MLATDEAKRRQYEGFKDFWEQKNQTQADGEKLFKKIKSRITTESSITRVNVVAISPDRNSVMWRKIAAASILIVCCLAGYFWKTLRSENLHDNLAVLDCTITKPGSKSIITLTDGTQVTVNSASELKYPASFEGKTREVFLVGEAFFDVHKDHEHPFIVHTGKMNIKVLGTAFNVKAYPKDLTSETTLIRGMIEITLKDRPSDRIILKPNDKLILKTGLEFDQTKNEAKKVNIAIDPTLSQYTLTALTHLTDGDTAVVETSWLEGKLVFRNEDFASLALRLQRWYGVNISFKNDEIKTLRFNGTFEHETVDEALSALKRTENFHYKINGTDILIY